VLKAAVPALIQALQDPDWNVRLNAAEALWNIGTPEAKAAAEAFYRQPGDFLLERIE
jgi:HEAT repeat protein